MLCRPGFLLAPALLIAGGMSDRSSLPGLEDDVRGVARRILEYLALHPHATDTAEEVEHAVRQLVARRLVEQTLKPDGEWIYSPSPSRPRPAVPEVPGAS